MRQTLQSAAWDGDTGGAPYCVAAFLFEREILGWWIIKAQPAECQLVTHIEIPVLVGHIQTPRILTHLGTGRVSASCFIPLPLFSSRTSARPCVWRDTVSLENRIWVKLCAGGAWSLPREQGSGEAGILPACHALRIFFMLFQHLYILPSSQRSCLPPDTGSATNHVCLPAKLHSLFQSSKL